MSRKPRTFTLRTRTLSDVSSDLRNALLNRGDAVAAGNWDATDRIQLTLDALQDEAAALSSAVTKGK